MSDRNPNFHNRRSIRLKGYDYSQSGLYFITLCVQNREPLFGEILGANVGAILRDRPENNNSTIKGDHDSNISKGDHDSNNSKGDHAGSPQRRMILNEAGKMIEKWYTEMENKFPNIRCHEMIVMPNHFHCIVEITNAVVSVGVPLCGHPDDIPGNDDPNSQYGPDNKKYNPTIGAIVGWLKTMTTNEYIRGVKNVGWHRFDGKLWQRDYWEHIIRDEGEYIMVLC